MKILVAGLGWAMAELVLMRHLPGEFIPDQGSEKHRILDLDLDPQHCKLSLQEREQ